MDKQILQALANIERYTLLSAKSVLSIEDVALLTGLSVDTIHRKVGAREIPAYRPNGKNLYFDKAEIEAWMKRGRIATRDEVVNEARTCIKKGGKS